MNFKTLLTFHPKNLLKLKRRNIDEKLIMLLPITYWFDKDCRFKRHQLRKLANHKYRDPNNIEIRSAYHAALKDYRSTLEMKKKNFHFDKIQEIENASSNAKLKMPAVHCYFGKH
jgi:hypothetical protein